MHVTYKCNQCTKIQDISFSIITGPPKHIFCPTCNIAMNRIWTAHIHIIEDFSDDLTTTISQKMRSGARPSGRTKVLY